MALVIENFVPDFTKEYEKNHKKFEVQVQFIGLDEEIHAPVLIWKYRIVHDEKNFDGEFFWDPSDFALKSENVANHVAMYYNPV